MYRSGVVIGVGPLTGVFLVFLINIRGRRESSSSGPVPSAGPPPRRLTFSSTQFRETRVPMRALHWGRSTHRGLPGVLIKIRGRRESGGIIIGVGPLRRTPPNLWFSSWEFRETRTLVYRHWGRSTHRGLPGVLINIRGRRESGGIIIGAGPLRRIPPAKADNFIMSSEIL
jgi:hypothetical protein